MARFFIDRPILARVFAIFISIAGLIALPFLPVAQYPKVAPPQLSITTSYPGASPQDIYQGVTRQIEEELNGVEHLSYFESTSDTSGAMTITATFAAGTDIDQPPSTFRTRYAASNRGCRNPSRIRASRSRRHRPAS